LSERLLGRPPCRGPARDCLPERGPVCHGHGNRELGRPKSWHTTPHLSPPQHTSLR
jgi:hypothetical protein